MIRIIKSFLDMMAAQKIQIYFSLLLNVIDGFFIGIPFVMAYFIILEIPELSCNMNALSMDQMIKYTSIMIVSLIIRVVLNYFIAYFRSGAGYKVMCQERKNIGRGMRNISLGSLSEKTVGDMVSTLTSDVAFLEIEGLGVVEKAANGIPAFITGLCILLYFDYRLLITVLIFLIPIYPAYKNLFAIQNKYKINRQNFIGRVTEQILEFIKGIHVLKNYNMAEKQFVKTKRIFEDLKNFSVKVEFLHIIPASLFQFCFRCMVSALIFCTAYLFVRGEIIFADVFLLMISSLMMFTGIEAMGVFSVFSTMTAQSIERINRIKDMKTLQSISGKDAVNKCDICFEDVSFAYDKKRVLHNINFYIPENTTTAFVGPSGSGKTTVTSLIARFWDIGQGRISIGGKEIKSINYENLLANISFVFQDVFLFNDTIMNNIKIGKQSASDEEVYVKYTYTLLRDIFCPPIYLKYKLQWELSKTILLITYLQLISNISFSLL